MIVAGWQLMEILLCNRPEVNQIEDGVAVE